jgi:hypothetical protein
MRSTVTRWVALGALTLLLTPTLRADDTSGCASCGAGGGCVTPATHNCPPKFCHIYEGPPCIKFKHGCPKPVCDPCNLPHAGYYATCWRSWAYAPDWSHCSCPPPSLQVVPPPPPMPPSVYAPTAPRKDLPTPRTAAPRQLN